MPAAVSASPRIAAFIATLAVVGCPRPADVVPTGPRSPLSPNLGSAAPIDVQSHDARPKLALIRRDGDPRPAIVIAVAGGAGAVGHAALRSLLEARLAARGVVLDVHSDGVGLRAVALPAKDEIEALLSSWITVTSTPVSREEVAVANAGIEALRAHPLSSPVLAPVAACAGDAAVVAEQAKAMEHAELETLRRRALVMERTAVAVVGDASMAEAASDAMADVEGWPRGAIAEKAGVSAEHGAFFASDRTRDTARLHVAFHVADAVDAVGVASRLQSGPPLSTKLDALRSPWALDAIDAVALPAGGCVRVVLRSQRPVAIGELASSAARALAVVHREMAQQAELVTDPFVVTREIVGAGSARRTAERAAWWALSAARSSSTRETTIAASALEVGAMGKEPLMGPDGTPIDETVIHAEYVRRAAKSAAVTDPVAERRVHAEIGQGQFWVMLGSPCPLLHEGQWDAGMTALAATAAAAQASDPTVTLEPWVSADGAGVIAHSALIDGNESAEAQARRVTLAAARAYATVPHDANAFARAHRVALSHVGSDLGVGFSLLARRVFPDHPSWIAPWGGRGRVAVASLLDAAEHWRGILHKPARLAVLSNREVAQAEVAAEIVDHWLLPEASGRPCDEVPALGAPESGTHAVAAGTPFVMVAIPYRGAGERRLAELTAALLDDPGDELHRGGAFEVQVVGGRRGGAVVLSAQVAGADVEQVEKRALNRIGALSHTAKDSAAAVLAQKRWRRARLAARDQPSSRLVALWLGEDDDVAPDSAAWASWVAKRAAPDRVVVVKSK